MWILIIFFMAGGSAGGVSTTTIQFNSQESCQTAQQQVLSSKEEWRNFNTFQGIGAICVER